MWHSHLRSRTAGIALFVIAVILVQRAQTCMCLSSLFASFRSSRKFKWKNINWNMTSMWHSNNNPCFPIDISAQTIRNASIEKMHVNTRSEAQKWWRLFDIALHKFWLAFAPLLAASRCAHRSRAAQINSLQLISSRRCAVTSNLNVYYH